MNSTKQTKEIYMRVFRKSRVIPVLLVLCSLFFVLGLFVFAKASSNHKKVLVKELTEQQQRLLNVDSMAATLFKVLEQNPGATIELIRYKDNSAPSLEVTTRENEIYLFHRDGMVIRPETAEGRP
jgi:hypothetical protein